tara:strand:- start:753 stop:2132 length:1380 start_codon:yes stop_codon:yes gene_type:complete
MPSGAIDARTNQQMAMAALIHQRWTSTECRDLLGQFVDLSTGQPSQPVSQTEEQLLRELHQDWVQANALPESLVKELTAATSTGQHQWQLARASNDGRAFIPILSDIVELQKKKADALGWQDHPYDALLNEFEPGMTMPQLTPIFDELKTKLIPLIQQKKVATVQPLPGEFSVENQTLYSNELMELLNFDVTKGRMDTSTHPFTIDIHPSDVRFTTRYSTDNLMESVSSTIHELGHALYEQGLPFDWEGTPLGQARSMAFHESQSRLWEIFICQSLPFWTGQYPRLCELFPQLNGLSAEYLYQQCHQVLPQWCRVASDPVTYNMHIIIRYEIELALLGGDIGVADIPQCWNQKMVDYLGIEPASDAQGWLQDVHWSAGLFGYFPTYALGTILAAQLYALLKTEIPNLHDQVAQGHMRPINNWLIKHIHSKGRSLTTNELMKSLGICYDVDAFLMGLQQK